MLALICECLFWLTALGLLIYSEIELVRIRRAEKLRTRLLSLQLKALEALYKEDENNDKV